MLRASADESQVLVPLYVCDYPRINCYGKWLLASTSHQAWSDKCPFFLSQVGIIEFEVLGLSHVDVDSGLMSSPLEIVFQEQSYSSLHSGWSLA